MLFINRSNFLPDSSFYRGVGLEYVPQFARFCYLVQPLLWTFVGIMHVGEVVWVVRRRLRRYRVEVFGRVWWAWVGNVFVEGFAAIMRFDEEVRRLEEEGRGKGKEH